MGNDKSKFLVLRSLLPWVALGLAISFIWLGGGVNTRAAEVPPPPAPPNHATLTINLETGMVTNVELPEGGTRKDGNDIPQIPDNAEVTASWIKYNRNPDCITIYQYGQPIEVCGP